MTSLLFTSCLLPKVNHHPNIIYFLIRKVNAKKKKQNFILFLLFGTMIAFRGLMEISGNVSGVILFSRELMLLRLWLMYWKKGMHILSYIKSCYSSIGKNNLTIYQELQNLKSARNSTINDYSKISNIPFQVYIISLL